MNWVILVTFLVALISILVYWFLRKPSGCKDGDSCTGSDPNGVYTYDSNCNCIITGCTGNYYLSNMQCVPKSTCVPNSKCTPSGTPDALASYAYNSDCSSCVKTCNSNSPEVGGLCTLAIPGLVNGETVNYQQPATSIDDCTKFCQSKSDCAVYDYDGTTCVVYNDYRSVRGFGGFSSHFIDRVTPDKSHMTYVVPFSSNSEMGTGKMAYMYNAKIKDSIQPYTTCKAVNDSGTNCADQCLNDDKCQAIGINQQTPLTGYLYSGINYSDDIAPGPQDSFLYVKVKSTL